MSALGANGTRLAGNDRLEKDWKLIGKISLLPIKMHCGSNVTDNQPRSPEKIQDLKTNRGVQMKKLFLGTVALVALGLGAPAAFAADRPVPYTPPPPPVPVYTWTGCYVGASAGTSYGTSTHS